MPLTEMILPSSRLNTAATQRLNPSWLSGNREVGGGQLIRQKVQDARQDLLCCVFNLHIDTRQTDEVSVQQAQLISALTAVKLDIINTVC